MDLALVKRENMPKEILSVNIYCDVADELREICKKEEMKMSHLIRHCLNKFLEEYKNPRMGV